LFENLYLTTSVKFNKQIYSAKIFSQKVIHFWVAGGLGCVGAKLNVVQELWCCTVDCTSFDFAKG
jgi:hypothetical protein